MKLQSKDSGLIKFIEFVLPNMRTLANVYIRFAGESIARKRRIPVKNGVGFHKENISEIPFYLRLFNLALLRWAQTTGRVAKGTDTRLLTGSSAFPALAKMETEQSKSTTTILCIGMAGSGKTTLLQARLISQLLTIIAIKFTLAHLKKNRLRH
jgi:hypothetical protein